MKYIICLLLAVTACHCYPNIEPAHARDRICSTTCRIDSGGHSICRTRCR